MRLKCQPRTPPQTSPPFPSPELALLIAITTKSLVYKTLLLGNQL
jgi:hypothetical protein